MQPRLSIAILFMSAARAARMRADRHTRTDIIPRGRAERDPHARARSALLDPVLAKCRTAHSWQRAGQPVNILALSGGGADGAFGAGALVGLTRSALRPQFSVVTGVSTGALIAPYAFLGSDWDDELIEVYTSGRAEHLLHVARIGGALWLQPL